jgi:hypothetical protein
MSIPSAATHKLPRTAPKSALEPGRERAKTLMQRSGRSGVVVAGSVVGDGGIARGKKVKPLSD